MAEQHTAITETQAELLRNAKLFFVASADPAMAGGPHGIGPVNVSPKGGVPLLLVSPTRVAYLDYPGSGNETVRHAQAGGPMTLMACSFEPTDAAIVRLYGRGSAQPMADSPYAETLLAADRSGPTLAIRQVVVLDVESTMTSCGYGVPVMEFVRHRAAADRGRRYKDQGGRAKP
ncbi:MAG: pyridoxamine 5'-phosphate oxidase family protein [Candidatus Eisenbacteria bacterium]